MLVVVVYLKHQISPLRIYIQSGLVWSGIKSSVARVFEWMRGRSE